MVNKKISRLVFVSLTFSFIRPSPPSQASPLSGYSPIYFKLPFLNTCRSFCFPPNPSFPLMHDVQRPKLQSSSRPHSSDSLDKYSESSTTTSSSAIQIPQRSKTPPTILSSYLSSTLGHTLRQSESTGSLQGHNVLYNRPNPAFLPPILCTTSRFYELFSRSLEMMWICWELMVLGEPVLVIADNPKSASDTIWGLVELIKPVRCGWGLSK